MAHPEYNDGVEVFLDGDGVANGSSEGFRPAGGGSRLHLALAATDNDEEASRQVSYAYLRTPTQTISPWLGCEAVWGFDLKLEPRFPLLGW